MKVPPFNSAPAEMSNPTPSQLAATINRVWAACGHNANARVEKLEGVTPVGVVRSDLLNGLPRK